MTDEWHYFLLDESKTGLCIAYNRTDGQIYVRSACHPTFLISCQTDTLVCRKCDRRYDGEYLRHVINEWSVSWNIIGEPTMTLNSSLKEWVAEWTNIHPDKINVETITA